MLEMTYRDVWGKCIPLKQIKLHYSCGWMESESRKHYTYIKEIAYFAKKFEEEILRNIRRKTLEDE